MKSPLFDESVGVPSASSMRIKPDSALIEGEALGFKYSFSIKSHFFFLKLFICVFREA